MVNGREAGMESNVRRSGERSGERGAEKKGGTGSSGGGVVMSNLERVAVRNLVHPQTDAGCVGVGRVRSGGSVGSKGSVGEKGAVGIVFPTRPKAPQNRWTTEDDDKVLSWVETHGPRLWTTLSTSVFAGTRSAAQLRGRYMDVLNPRRVDEEWTPEEDAKVLLLHQRIGNRWTVIADELDGRVANDVKNRYRLLMRAKVPH
eukprot:CAMPEP_0185857054 /NCGR_PEP_ID=MMETSP1354-20130828/29310_1 /TAXON_ID=708628 /ORGANISM="Erythrolobus madagascarensis, Strain CCMP3276" /LENGTH=201 /DNA_ID=CAMNT_0028559317 /DNA_START=472 /DNA_END=1077 /DNA_ORIENTATION=-